MIQPDCDPRDALRLRALHAALAGMGREGAALLELHPERSALGAPGAVESLEWIQWEELEGTVAALGAREEGLVQDHPRCPESYLALRREAQRLRDWRGARDVLPARWVRLLGLDAPAVRAVTFALGYELLVRAARGLPADELPGWLAPLGSALAQRVLQELVRRRDEPPAPLAGGARRAFEECRREQRGERLVGRLGRRALAGDLAALAPDARALAARAGLSNLGQLVVATAPLACASDAERAALEALVEEHSQGAAG